MKERKYISLLSEETLSKKLITKGFWLYLFSYLIAPAGYLIRLIITNSPEVTVADVGILYSIISLVNFLNVYNDLGLTESLQFFLPRFWIKKEYNYVKTILYFSFFAQFSTAVLICFILWFGSDWLSVHYFHSEVASQILKMFCLYFLGVNLLQTLTTIFNAFQKVFDQKFVDFVRIWGIVIFSAFCFLTGRGTILRYSFNWILGIFLGIFLALFLFRKYHDDILQGKFVFDKSMLKDYCKYAFWAFLGVEIGSFFTALIQQIVIVWLGAESAGYFSNFNSLFGIGDLLIGPIVGVIFPIVSEITEKNDKLKLNSLLSFFYTYFSTLILSFVVLVINFGEEISIALFGEKYLISGTLLEFAGIFLLFAILAGFNFSVLAGMGKVKERVKILGLVVILTIFTSGLFIYYFDLYGASFAFGLSYLFLWLFSFLYLIRLSRISLNFRFMLKNIIYFLILGVLLHYIKNGLFVDNDRWIYIVKLIVIGFVYYCILGILNFPYVKQFKSEVLKIKQ